jgi:hypothetical protein
MHSSSSSPTLRHSPLSPSAARSPWRRALPLLAAAALPSALALAVAGLPSSARAQHPAAKDAEPAVREAVAEARAKAEQAAVGEPHRTLVLSVRAPGAAQGSRRATELKIDLDTETLETRAVQDSGGRLSTVQGVLLSQLLPRLNASKLHDAARLRFANGTEVLLPLWRLSLFEPFIARRVQERADGPFRTAFAPVPLGEAHWRSARALQFAGNRVFVSRQEAPHSKDAFSPWGFTDSLVEVELVNEKAWLAVFEVDPKTRRGVEVWRNRCQSCHGAHQAGATFGWDFVKPLPLHTWRTPETLFTHVKDNKISGAAMGLAMPPQPDVTREETDALHAWMKALAQKPLKPYAPPLPTPE